MITHTYCKALKLSFFSFSFPLSSGILVSVSGIPWRWFEGLGHNISNCLARFPFIFKEWVWSLFCLFGLDSNHLAFESSIQCAYKRTYTRYIPYSLVSTRSSISRCIIVRMKSSQKLPLSIVQHVYVANCTSTAKSGASSHYLSASRPIETHSSILPIARRLTGIVR